MSRAGYALLASAIVLGGGLAAGLVTAASAAANAGALSDGAATTSSGRWSAVLVDATGADALGRPLTLAWPVGINAAQVVSVRNNGTLPLVGGSYTLTQTGGVSTTITATACVGGTWSGATCSGRSVVVATTGVGSPGTVAVPLAIGAVTQIRVTAGLALGATAQFGVSTTRAHTRVGETSTS